MSDIRNHNTNLSFIEYCFITNSRYISSINLIFNGILEHILQATDSQKKIAVAVYFGSRKIYFQTI